MDSDRKCKFHRFCPARSDCNNIAHAILSCYKLQGAFNQFNEKIWKLQLKYFSYNSSSFDLYLHIKIHQFVRKNSQNAGVNRAKRLPQTHGYICSLHPPTSLRQRKSTCLLNCALVNDRLHNSETRPRSPFDRSNFVCLSSTLRISGFHNNWMKNRCRVVLKRCVNVIGRNACALAWLTK